MSNSKTVELRSPKAGTTVVVEVSDAKKKKDVSRSNIIDVEKNQIKMLLRNLPKVGMIFDIHKKIGEGTFSSVYLGSLKHHSELPDNEKRWFAIKHLVPTSHPARIEQELRCLREIGGKHNVIGVDLCLRHLDNVVFVMPYIPHVKFVEALPTMTGEELRRYMHALLSALAHVHSFGVIHRDVKPSNFLYDRLNQRYLLVDFGLSQRIAERPAAAAARVPLAERDPAAAAAAATAAAAAQHANDNAERVAVKRARDDDEPEPTAKRVALDLTMKNVQNQKLQPKTMKPQLPLENKQTAAAAAGVGAMATGGAAATGGVAGAGAGARCACWGVAGVCAACAGRAGARAPRAGTQGFRPPEVLLKYPHQTTAVDVWAAGVVLAAALAGRHPLLRAAGDAAALAELAALLGDRPLRRAAANMGRRMFLSRPRNGICLRKLSARIRNVADYPPPPSAPGAPASPACPEPRGGARWVEGGGWELAKHMLCRNCSHTRTTCLCLDSTKPRGWFCPEQWVGAFPDSAFGLAARLLDPDPRSRLSAARALHHPFITTPLSPHSTPPPAPPH